MSDLPDILTLYPVSKIRALERRERVDASIAKQLSQSMSINAKLQTRIEALEAALQHLVQWSETYPIDTFSDPNWKHATELLTSGGITLDAVSAYCMRHVAKGVGNIARAALDKDAGA